jgi:hypothetical protein
MKVKLVTLAVCLTTCLSTPVKAENEVVVTGLRSTSEGFSGLPAVTIKKQADFLVQEIELSNDSRAPDLRKKEMISTIEAMLKRAASDKRIALSYGKGFLLPIEITEEALQIIEGKGRSDTSSIRIFVKITLAPDDNAKARIIDLKKFIANTQVVGRTEVESVGDVGLSVVNPEKYRYELLTKIAEDNRKLAKAIGGKCKVALTELARRVSWRRTEVAELTLYIPYDAQVNDCVYEP